ncbi:MAG TPA: BTAD domain-containing putative transcriptional regulator, partial [Micromonosporaceae bacterium]|nr:BTAD domain-containing putative transcriptional regulator [Micromonosporaceae bacterium]
SGPFVEAERVRLTEQYLGALEEWAGLALALGQHNDVVADLRDRIAEQPLRENLWALLILALYRCGRQGEALATFERARRDLVEALGVEPGLPLRRLHAQILNDDPALGGPASTVVQAQLPVPAQLPAEVSDFCGRTEELTTLRQLLGQPGGAGMPVCVVVGTAGIGKTAFAVRVAHQVRSYYHDGQFYVDLRGADPTPADPGDVLGAFLRALGVDQAPSTLEERAALYRSALAGRRTLVVLDNAHSASQVTHLLPGAPGCAVIITSRDGLPTLPCTRRIQLDVLSEAESVEVLERVVGGADCASAASVARLCGYLPLALRIAGARARYLPGRSMAVLAKRLAGDDRRLRELELPDLSVRSSFELSYRALADDARRGFRLLGLSGGPDIAVSTAGALLDAVQPEPVLQHLVHAHLLEEHRTGRYRMHDLIRLYAHERALADEPEPARADAVNRLLRAYLSLGRHAGRLVQPDREDPPTVDDPGPFEDRAGAFEWFEDERTNLVMAMHTGPWPLVGQLARALRWLFRSYGHSDEWQKVNERMVELARANDEPVPAADFLEELGLLCDERGDLPGLMRRAEESIVVRRAAGDRKGETKALINLGVAHHRRGALQDAIRHYLRGLEAARQLDSPRAEAYALANLAAASRDAGAYDDATRYTGEALAISRAIGDRFGEASFVEDLALTHRAAGRFADAVTAHEEALTALRGLNNLAGEGDALRQLGETYLAAGDPSSALTTLKNALDVLVRTGNHHVQGLTLWQAGLAHRELGEAEQARQCWVEALAVFTELGAPEADQVRSLLKPSTVDYPF